MKEINIKITNAKQLIAVLEDIKFRAESVTDGYRGTYQEGYTLYKSCICTLIKVLEEAK